MTLLQLGRMMMDWVTGSKDPIYIVASHFVYTEVAPNIDPVRVYKDVDPVLVHKERTALNRQLKLWTLDKRRHNPIRWRHNHEDIVKLREIIGALDAYLLVRGLAL